jgi:hypothetical protein
VYRTENTAITYMIANITRTSGSPGIDLNDGMPNNGSATVTMITGNIAGIYLM